MKRGKWVTKGVVFGMVLVVAALSQLGTSGAAPATKVIELSDNHYYSVESWMNKVIKDFAAEIEKQTSGQVKITVFPGALLTKADQVYEGVIKGISDIGRAETSFTPGRFPLMEVISLPWGPSSGWQGSLIANEFYKKFRPKELDDTELLYFYTPSPVQLHSNKPVYKLEDFKGLKIRSIPTIAPIIQALGAVPVFMPMPDAFEALQRGTIDGTVTAAETLKSFRLAEVTKYTTVCSLCCGLQFVTMNRDKWKSLSPEIKKVFQDVSEKFAGITGKGFDENDLIAKNFSLSLGNKFIIVPPEELRRWGERIQPIMDKWVAEKEAKGLPAKAALDEVLKLKEKYK